MYPIFDTVGIEIEVENVDGGKLVLPNGWSRTHDASVESDGRSNGTVEVRSPRSIPIRTSGMVLGTEIVSVPLILENKSPRLLDDLKLITGVLARYGESHQSTRAGIHVHINIPWNLEMLKNIVQVGAHIEDLMFRIGGMGYEFRGVSTNRSQFCRPITEWGPQCVQYNGRWVQLYDIAHLQSAKTTPQFWTLYGGVGKYSQSPPRYHPVRYTWLNLYSLLAHGTLEFRIFNKTLNPHFINAVVVLCQTIARRMCFGLYENPSEMNSVFTDNPNMEERFHELIHGIENEDVLHSLNMIWEKSPKVVLDGDWHEYIATHLRREVAYDFGHYSPKTIQSPSKYKVSDIHTLRGE